MAGGNITGADWGTDANWDSAAKPTANDQAIVPPTNGNNITDTGGTAKTIDLNLLRTHPGYLGSFGAEGAPIRTAADIVHVANSGGFYFECNDASPLLITDEIFIEPQANSRAPIQIGSDPGDLGQLDKIYAMRGDVLIKGNAIWKAGAAVHTGYMTAPAGDVVLTVANGATLPELNVNGGKVFCNTVVTKLSVSRGEVVQDVAKAITIHIFGGILTYNHAASGTDVTLCVVHPGATLNLLGNSLLKTFVRTIALPNSRIIKDDDLHTLNLKDLR